MNRRLKDAVLWGAVGLLTFLVLVQGYELYRGEGIDLVVKAGGAVIVGLASTAITYVVGGRVGTAPAAGADGDGANDVDGDEVGRATDEDEAGGTDDGDDVEGDETSTADDATSGDDA